MTKFFSAILIFSAWSVTFIGFINAQNLTPCSLIKTELFNINRSRIAGLNGFNSKLAIDAKGVIAFSSCDSRFIFFIDDTGKIIDSMSRPNENCIRNMEFDESGNLQIIDNSEKYIYKYYRPGNIKDSLPYNKPEDWYYNLNHYYRHYELSSIPAYFYNPNYIQESYYTRFSYGYNFFVDYKVGVIYQSNYNFIKRIGDKQTYEKLKKEDFWFSDFMNNKTKILMIDEPTKRAVYFDRSLKLVCEDFINEKFEIYDCGRGIKEPAQFDFSTNIYQQCVYGISYFNKDYITFSKWELPDKYLNNK